MITIEQAEKALQKLNNPDYRRTHAESLTPEERQLWEASELQAVLTLIAALPPQDFVQFYNARMESK